MTADSRFVAGPLTTSYLAALALALCLLAAAPAATFAENDDDPFEDMPRSCSMDIQSLVAWLLVLRDFTAPAILMAPPKRRSFSVRVVFPASG